LDADHPATGVLFPRRNTTGREAGLYRAAVVRFTRESVQNAQAVDKPMLAGHPVGRLAYGITSFMFAFTRNVVLRTIKSTQTALDFKNGLTADDRLRMAAPLMAFSFLTLAQYGVSRLREWALNPVDNAERDPWTTTILHLDRTGMFENASPFINMVTSAKYNKSAEPTGPYLSTYLQNIQKLTTALVPQPMGPNSPNTNNAEHSAVRAAYRAIVAPLAIAGLSLLPGGALATPLAGAAAIALSAPGASRAVADTLVGERTVRPRQPGSGTRSAGTGGIRGTGGYQRHRCPVAKRPTGALSTLPCRTM
jgi:hypothetical protein